MKYFITLSILFCISMNCMSQVNDACSIDIFIDVPIGNYLEVNKVPDTIKSKLSNGEYIEVELEDCKGAMKIKVSDEEYYIRIIGRYSNSLDIFKHYVYYIEPVTLKEEIKVEEYYYPLKDGTWKYYNKKAELVKEVSYDMGKFIQMKEY